MDIYNQYYRYAQSTVSCVPPQGLKGQLHSKLHPGHRHKKKSAYPFEEDREALLENPMLDPDIDNVDFSNPVFDHEKAKLRDAAIAIQAWYRMWRHRVPYLQLRESALIVQVSCISSHVSMYTGIPTVYVYIYGPFS